MELIKDVIKVDNRIDFGKFQTFIESELVVPDKKLDVEEIIDVMGYISIKKIELNEGKITVRGCFNYNIIYMATDKNTISNMNGKIDINEVIEKDNINQDMENMLFAEIEHIDFSIMNERKIKLGALMNIKGSLFEKKKINIVKDVSQVEDVQKFRKEITYQDIVGIESGESSIKDNININMEQIDSIISLNPTVKIKDTRVADNKVIIGGCVEINPLASTYDSEVVELDKIGIDFTQFIEVPGACEGMKDEVLINIGEFNYNFNESTENMGSLEIDCVVNCKVKIIDEVTREFLQDAYSPHKIIKFDHKSVQVNKLLTSDTETFPIRETIKNTNDSVQIKDVISCNANISIENNYIEKDKSIIQGIVRLDILYVPVEGLKLLYKITEEIPFKHEIDIENLNEDCKVFNSVCIEKLDLDLNKDEIDLSMKVRRYVEAMDKSVERFIVKGEDLGEYDLSKAPSLIVYICKEGDTLWNVAKKYNTTEDEIAELNELKLDEKLVPGKCLILEKKVSLFD